MQIFKKKGLLIKKLEKTKTEGCSIGFVPTMGALHQGHIKLAERAKKENDLVVCSIFVNPTQFNNKEDLKKYPRTLNNDIKLLKSAGCDILFAPEENEMYPSKKNRIASEPAAKINFGELDKVMEGKFRPGHFKGVAVIVDKLFSIVRPDRAYFGEKDYQQLLIIKKMTQELGHKIRIIPCATVREKDGLAMSSRNRRLSREQRKAAPFIFIILKRAKNLSKKMSFINVKIWVEKEFSLNRNFNLEYFEIADAGSLQPKERKGSGKAIACIAAYMGGIRLIDNIKL